jgi:tetratricopeptide (TPR) repeat protein
MRIQSNKHTGSQAAMISFFVAATLLHAAYAADPAYRTSSTETLTDIQKEQARQYRAQGLQYQNSGDLGKARIFYQKAVELDPLFAAGFNDLGVLSESTGMLKEAESYYLKALQLDPAASGPYTNLALLYEQTRQLEKAAEYWEKRLRMGMPDDPWAIKSRQHLANIRSVLGLPSEVKETRDLDFFAEVTREKEMLSVDDKALARTYMESAERYAKVKEYARALREAVNAHQLDPSNTAITKFIEKTQIRALAQ